MNVYEVVADELVSGKGIHRITEYVSSASIDLVFKHYLKQAKELDRELLSVRYVLTVVREIE